MGRNEYIGKIVALLSFLTDNTEWETRSAIQAMIKLIKKSETLRNILVYVNSAYFKEV